jgi:hypothetical protein
MGKKKKIGPVKISGRAGPLGRDDGKSRKDTVLLSIILVGFSPSIYYFL